MQRGTGRDSKEKSNIFYRICLENFFSKNFSNFQKTLDVLLVLLMFKSLEKARYWKKLFFPI